MTTKAEAKPKDYPCTAQEAVERARSVVGQGGQYLLGSGDYIPGAVMDLPWTPRGGKMGSDCAGFAICWAWKLVRHRPGFNNGAWASVEDDINCNSTREDGLHARELFDTLPKDECAHPGDLLLYPTIRLKGKAFIGHVGIVESVPIGWEHGDWGQLTILQCHGPNGRSPGVVRTDGRVWVRHDTLWSKPNHCSVIVRPRERV